MSNQQESHETLVMKKTKQVHDAIRLTFLSRISEYTKNFDSIHPVYILLFKCECEEKIHPKVIDVREFDHVRNVHDAVKVGRMIAKESKDQIAGIIFMQPISSMYMKVEEDLSPEKILEKLNKAEKLKNSLVFASEYHGEDGLHREIHAIDVAEGGLGGRLYVEQEWDEIRLNVLCEGIFGHTFEDVGDGDFFYEKESGYLT